MTKKIFRNIFGKLILFLDFPTQRYEIKASKTIKQASLNNNSIRFFVSKEYS